MNVRQRLAGMAKAAAILTCVVSATPALAEAPPVAREALTFAQEVTDVPRTAVNVLRLPLGLVECVFSPLPEVEFMSGLRHIGQGIVAPFKFVEAVVSLPFDAVKAATGIAAAVPQAALLPAVIPVP
jgi:hypothetical protein